MTHNEAGAEKIKRSPNQLGYTLTQMGSISDKFHCEKEEGREKKTSQ